MTKQINFDVRDKDSNIGICFSDLLLSRNIITNLSVYSNTYLYLTVSLGQEFRHDLSGSSASRSPKAAIKVSVRVLVSQMLKWESSSSTFTWLLAEFISLQAVE